MARKSKAGYTLEGDSGKSKVTGLSIRTTTNGARSYVFERRLHGRTIRVTIEACYPLERVRDALAHAARSDRSGKILLLPNPHLLEPILQNCS